MPAITEDTKINVRIKLAALWTAVMFLYIYGDYFELYVPGKTSGLVVGENMLDSPAKLFVATFLLSIPSLLIFLTVMVKAQLARWLNIGFGVFFTLFTLLVGISSISAWRAFYVYLAFLETVVTAVIVVTAWKWKKQAI